MLSNPIRDCWRDGRPVLNGWLSIPSTLTAEAMAVSGFDALTIDNQHGLSDYRDTVEMLPAMRARGCGLMVRVPWLDPASCMRSLDAGADGIICPMVSNADEAARFVSYVRYPPAGTRSFGPTRANLAFGKDYFRHANDHVIALAMIETREGMENIGEICDVEGLDGLYVGPADFALGHGFSPGMDREEPEIMTMYRTIVDTAHDRGLRVGLHTGSSAYAAKMVTFGFDLLTVGSDLRMMTGAAVAAIQSFRSHLNGESTEGTETPAGVY